MTTFKKCPLCERSHEVDYREDCYKRQGKRIKQMEDEIYELKKEIEELRRKIK